MSTQRWIQSTYSTKATKWLVDTETELRWHSNDRAVPLAFPKSEYVLCPPPEVYRDVTQEVCVMNDTLYWGSHQLTHQLPDFRYCFMENRLIVQHREEAP